MLQRKNWSVLLVVCFTFVEALGYNVKLKKAGDDSSADDSAIFKNALTQIGDKPGSIEIADGVFCINNILIPENVNLKFTGGKISIPQKGRIEINGKIDAGITEIFSGEGKVEGRLKNLYVYPQWFGAKGDEAQDDSPAIQKAASLAQSSCGRTLFIPYGRYLIENKIEMACNVECNGVIVKKLEVDETKTKKSFSTFTYTHYPKTNAYIFFKTDDSLVQLVSKAFFGTKKGEFKVKSFENIPVVGSGRKVNLKQGGTLSLYCNDFFTSRNNNYGDEWYDKNDQCQIVSPRGDVFPEFCFSYDAFPDVPEWSPEKTYKKGDYCKVDGKIYKASFPSGPGTVFENKFKGKVPIGPFSPANGEKFNFKYQDGDEDSLNIWVKLKMKVSYVPPQAPLTVNNLAIEIYMNNPDGKVKRLKTGSSLVISRSNMTFNNLSVSCKERNACLSSLCSIYRCSGLTFNNCTFSGATYHGLGYNITNSNVSNIVFNNCISVNCRDAIAGRHGKNITVNGGFFFSIDDHYGKNYTIRNAVIQGISTKIPGYMTPEADLQKWHFIPRAAVVLGGGDVFIENCRIYNTSNVLILRGGEADMEDSRITIKNIVIKNKSDIRVVGQWVSKDFDFAHKLKLPQKVVLENIKINEPYRISFFTDLPDDLKYGDISARNCGPWANVKTNADSVSFVDCDFKDSNFELGKNTLCNFSNCVFKGKIEGLSKENLGRLIGNCKYKGTELSFPLNYINPNIYEVAK
jgi:hypothetical protein